jgi:hypothetical protein
MTVEQMIERIFEIQFNVTEKKALPTREEAKQFWADLMQVEDDWYFFYVFGWATHLQCLPWGKNNHIVFSAPPAAIARARRENYRYRNHIPRVGYPDDLQDRQEAYKAWKEARVGAC